MTNIKKHFIISQPPSSENFTLLVDLLSDNKNFGYTNDIDACLYNLDLISKLYPEFFIELQTTNILSDNGTTSFIPLGRYICVSCIFKNEKPKEMYFFDIESDVDISKQGVFSKNILAELERVRVIMLDKFSPEVDRFQLHQYC